MAVTAACAIRALYLPYWYAVSRAILRSCNNKRRHLAVSTRGANSWLYIILWLMYSVVTCRAFRWGKLTIISEHYIWGWQTSDSVCHRERHPRRDTRHTRTTGGERGLITVLFICAIIHEEAVFAPMCIGWMLGICVCRRRTSLRRAIYGLRATFSDTNSPERSQA